MDKPQWNVEESPFAFYEVVVIQTDSPDKEQFNRAEGAILGMSQSEEGHWAYSVHILGVIHSWFFYEEELQPTGRHMKREDFYP